MTDTELVNAPKRPEVADAQQLSSWIEFAADPLRTRWAELEPALRKCATEHTEITDKETAGVFAENIKMASELVTDIATLHRSEKAPYWDGGKQWDFWKNDFTAQIEALLEPMRAVLEGFGSKQSEELFGDTRVTGPYGATATIKMVWGYEVTDFALVPDDYKELDESAIKKVMRARDPKTGRPRRDIRGIKWVQKPQLAVS